jgi:hypothetical protein
MAKRDDKAGPKFERELEVPISKAIRDKKLERIAEIGDLVEIEQAKLRAEGAGRRETIKGFHGEEKRLREDVKKSTELRKVKCVTKMNYRENIVQVIRIDTKVEVERREMTVLERQEKMKYPAPNDGKGAKVLNMLDGGKGKGKAKEAAAGAEEPPAAPPPEPPPAE